MTRNLATRILLAFSSAPRKTAGRHSTPEDALKSLTDAIPNFADMIRDRRVLDFGCGTGQHAIAMCLAGARSVVGLDINERYLEAARNAAAAARVADRAEFRTNLNQDERFDVVLSFNSMEHFSEPGAVLAQMKAAVVPDGKIVIAFSPPWLSAYGAHMHHITAIPWVHILFSERTVMDVRSRFMTDGATRYEDSEGGLNRMTVRRFERLIAEAGLRPVQWQLTPMKGIPLITRVPGLREFFTTRVAAVLQPA
jgi:SAM-dependent methyltransferase